MRKRHVGFSLIELLIVLVIIGIIAAIFIPNLLAARRSANEGSAISSVGKILDAEKAFQEKTGQYGTLAELRDRRLIDERLASGTKGGYRFSLPEIDEGGTRSQLLISAHPTTPEGISQTGQRRFGATEDGVIHADGKDLGYGFLSRGNLAASPPIN